jgi:hypothetical protein
MVVVSASKLGRFRSQSLVVIEASLACAEHCGSGWSCTGRATRRQRAAGSGHRVAVCRKGRSLCCGRQCLWLQERGAIFSQQQVERRTRGCRSCVKQERGGRRLVRPTTGQQRWRWMRVRRRSLPASVVENSSLGSQFCQYSLLALSRLLFQPSNHYRLSSVSAVYNSTSLLQDSRLETRQDELRVLCLFQLPARPTSPRESVMHAKSPSFAPPTVVRSF